MDIVEEHTEFIYFLILDDEDTALTARNTGLRIAGALSALHHIGTILRIRKRQSSRRYLTRPNLLPYPRVETPWQALFQNREDRAYITTMGVDVATFDYILESGFRAGWNRHPIPRGDVDPTGNV